MEAALQGGRAVRGPVPVGDRTALSQRELGLAAAPISGVRAGTTIIVTTTADETSIDGNCSLGEAILAANSRSSVDACPAGSGQDTILLPPGTYTLSAIDNLTDGGNGLPVITGETTVRGPDATLTRASSAPPFRLLEVGAGARVTLVGITIRGGRAVATDSDARGGGILNRGTLALDDVVVTGNTAVATTTSAARFATAAGGGIATDGSLDVRASQVTANRAIATGRAEALGGGVYINSNQQPASRNPTVTVSSSVVHGNSSSGTQLAEGGGICGFGGPSGIITVAGSDVSGNSVDSSFTALGGGVFIDEKGTFVMNRGRVTGNQAQGQTAIGGGAIAAGSLSASEDLIASNTATGVLRAWAGGLDVDQGTVTGSSIAANTASAPGGEALGGAVYGGDGPLSSTTTSFTTTSQAVSRLEVVACRFSAWGRS